MKLRTQQNQLDGLSLVGLGRVPACSECPRYGDLVDRYTNPGPRAATLARVPASCEHPYCAPLAERYGAQEPGRIPRLPEKSALSVVA